MKQQPLPFINEIWCALGGDPQALQRLSVNGDEQLASVFAVTDLACASMGAAGLAVSELIAARHPVRPEVAVERRFASMWFGYSLRAQGWQLPGQWDSVAGDYPCADGWIRLHTNAPHHRASALHVLAVDDSQDDDGGAIKSKVARAVAGWHKSELETAIVGQGGCAAAMHTVQEWARHPNGLAVAKEPLVWRESFAAPAGVDWPIEQSRPLRGIRVLDLTRVLAGPVATRLLAGLGAEVLRLDPPWWDEPAVLPDVTLGKRCARVDLRSADGAALFRQLLASADVLVHGYRNGALAALGLDQAERRRLRPGLVDVCLDAYGWTGPWQERRGFDSLVQMSSGIAAAGMAQLGKDKPFPLPVQALDHSAGYLIAAAALTGLKQRLCTGSGFSAKVSLARMASLLISGPGGDAAAQMRAESELDWQPHIEHTVWGPARRIRAPIEMAGTTLAWPIPAGQLGTSAARWEQ